MPLGGTLILFTVEHQQIVVNTNNKNYAWTESRQIKSTGKTRHSSKQAQKNFGVFRVSCNVLFDVTRK